MIEELLLPFQFEFMINAMIITAVLAVPCSLLSCYLVLKGWSLMGDAISHAVLPGIAVAFLITKTRALAPMFIGAMAVGMLTAFLSETIHRIGKVKHDASMGVVFTSLFALGVILISDSARQVDLDPDCVLYGSIETLSLDTPDLPALQLQIGRAHV